jgi:DNA (cytosine-5)-methyltransferase 1
MTGIPELHAVSLFSNCGAGDVGYARAGFNFAVMAELDPRRLSVAKLNVPGAELVPGDLRETWPEVVSAYRNLELGPPALLAACPPCQGMSSARSGRGKENDPDAGSRDERNLLVDVIGRVAHALKPRVIVVENVQAFLTRLVRHPVGGYPISAAALLARSLNGDYRLSALSADLADFGVPQQRKRAFLCFVRRDDPAIGMLDATARAPFPRPSHAPDAGGRHITLREALAALGGEELDAASAGTCGTGMHGVPHWDAQQYRMIATIPPNSGAGAWNNDLCDRCGATAGRDDAQCQRCDQVLPRPVVIEDDGHVRLVKGFRTSSYTRMHPDQPAATITTASGHVGSDRTVHPWENRVLSVAECSHLQTFPKNFDWGEALRKWGATNVRAMIGEAVPPQFTEQHGEVLAGLLTGDPRRAAIAREDRRVTKALSKLAGANAAARLAATELRQAARAGTPR